MKSNRKPKQTTSAKTNYEMRASSHFNQAKDDQNLDTPNIPKRASQLQQKETPANSGIPCERKFIDLTDPKFNLNFEI